MKTAPRHARRDPDYHTLFEDIYSLYGYDLREEKTEALWKKFERMMAAGSPQSTFSRSLTEDRALLQRALASFSIGPRPLFASSHYFTVLRQRVIPYLKTFPSLRIWVAGSGTAEEVYSLALLLREEKAPKFQIYATDLSELHLVRAKTGEFSPDALKPFKRAYRDSGGKKKFSQIFRTQGSKVKILDRHKDGISFFQHHLGSDASFNEFQLVLCRNNLAFLEEGIRERAFAVLNESLCPFGLLGLGHRNTPKNTPFAGDYREFDSKAKFYKKVPCGS